MSLIYSRHELSVRKIVDDFESETLIVDTSYQRRSVWLERDKIRLIETILLGLIIPEVYFWDAETDPDTGKTITHIVDGQQRIYAIVGFIKNEFKLRSEHLIDSTIKERFGDKFFENLDSDTRVSLWTYAFSVVHIKDKSKDKVRKIFTVSI
ncbi:MAG: DUF262 domain-containing protein [Tannerellaceae bacterium]|nr:DUF262 domain-containing protein [Tannerellaceae bacterium]